MKFKHTFCGNINGDYPELKKSLDELYNRQEEKNKIVNLLEHYYKAINFDLVDVKKLRFCVSKGMRKEYLDYLLSTGFEIKSSKQKLYYKNILVTDEL